MPLSTYSDSEWIPDAVDTSSQEKNGYLEIILGPMKSGKTSRLIQLYRQNEFCDIPTVVINQMSDKRYHDILLSTHDEIMIPCIQAERLTDLWSLPDSSTRSASVILINEGQFFPDLVPVVTDMVAHGKKVHVCGLDGDYKRDKFGGLLDLIPLCDSVTKLSSLCGLCKNGTAGIFTLRLTDETEQTVIGTSNYIPVCRGCYHTQTRIRPVR